MPVISTGLALGLGAAATAASAGASAYGAHKAAETQKSAAQQALDLEQQNQKKALALQQPYADAGKQGLNSLTNLLKTPGQGLLSTYQDFQAPTLEQAEQMPGYQFQLEQGTAALDKSAAARGDLFSGTQGTALENYGQGLAQTGYNNLYNQALQTYLTNFNTFNTGQTNEFNRLGTLAGIGQHAADESTAALTNFGGQQAQQINNAGAASASGTVGVTNSLASGLQNIGQLPLLSTLLAQTSPTRNSGYQNPVGTSSDPDYNIGVS